MAVHLKDFGSKLSYQDINDIYRLFASSTEPSNPFSGQIWLDISGIKPILKRYDEVEGWRDIAPSSGSGSGLDADMVDGLHAESFIRSDLSASFSGVLTSTRSGAAIRLDKGHAIISAAEAAGDFTIKSGVDENNNASVSNGGSRIAMNQNGVIKFAVTAQPVGSPFVETHSLQLDGSGVTISGGKAWHTANDGAGGGLDADKLDGLEAASLAPTTHNHAAANIVSGTINRSRLGDFWRDQNLTTSPNPFIQTGQESIGQISPGVEDIVFNYAFTDTPRVFCQVYGNTNDVTFVRTYYISTTSVRIYAMSASSTGGAYGTVDWIAIGPR